MNSPVAERVLAAVETVKGLNEEAGTSNDSLIALVMKSTSNKDLFERFSSELSSSIKACFKHFTRVRPHLAKVRAHQEFHQLRLETLPSIWKSFLTSMGLPEMDPLHYQSVNRAIFDSILKESLVLHRPPSQAKQIRTRLLGDEQNAIRYASGFVVMKLTKKLEKRSGNKAAKFRECLSQMANSRDNTSFYKYTMEWICSTDRGGLFHINDNTFILFEAIELKTQQVLPKLSGSQDIVKDTIVDAIVQDEIVQQYWWIIAIDIEEEEDSNELLHMLADMWVTMRGFALTSMWMEEYKKATAKAVKKSKSLRKDLQAKDHED